MRDAEAQLIQRYFRKTQANPDGAITHHGDCDIYGIKVCTCGLMHDLMPVPHLIEKLYPLHWEERGKYDEVRSSIMNSSRKTRKKRKK